MLQHQVRFLSFLAQNNLSLNESDFVGSPDTPTRREIFFVTRMFGTNEYLASEEMKHHTHQYFLENVKANGLVFSVLNRAFAT